MRPLPTDITSQPSMPVIYERNKKNARVNESVCLWSQNGSRSSGAGDSPFTASAATQHILLPDHHVITTTVYNSAKKQDFKNLTRKIS